MKTQRPQSAGKDATENNRIFFAVSVKATRRSESQSSMFSSLIPPSDVHKHRCPARVYLKMLLVLLSWAFTLLQTEDQLGGSSRSDTRIKGCRWETKRQLLSDAVETGERGDSSCSGGFSCGGCSGACVRPLPDRTPLVKAGASPRRSPAFLLLAETLWLSHFVSAL